MRAAWAAALIIVTVECSAATASAALVGDPPAVRHKVDALADPQNFDIVQNGSGQVYLANGSGVLVFDGERWRLVRLDNREMVRSLAIDGDDRVYVGGYNSFGYLHRDSAGEDQYVDLSGRFASLLGGREFNDIWRVVLTPEGVYFGGLRDLFYWDPSNDEIGYWRHEGRFGALIHHQGQTIAQFRGEGFRRRLGSEWIALPHTAELTTLRFGLLPLADGRLLAPGVDGRWMRIGSDTVDEVMMPVDLPASNAFEASLALADGTLVLGGSDGQVHVVDPSLRAVQRFALDSGFISGIAAATGGGFLASADQAFYSVAWPSAWSVLGAEHGLGDLLNIGRWQGQDYLLSSSGVLRIEPRMGTTPALQPAPWGVAQYTALQQLDDGRALLGTGHKLLLLDADGPRELTAELVYPRQFYPSRFRPERTYVATEAGLRYVDAVGSELSISPPSLPAGQELLVNSVVEESADILWFGSFRRGLWRVRLNAAGEIAEQQDMSAAQGLQLGVGKMVEVSQIGEELIANSKAGIYRWENGSFVAESLHGLDQLREPEELLSVAEQQGGVIWAYGLYRVLRYTADGGWQTQPVDQLRRGALRALRISDQGRVEFVATRSLLLYAGSSSGAAQYRPQVRLRSVSLEWNDGRRQSLPLHPEQPPEVPFGDYGISFQFALPDLAYDSGRAYRGRLLGYEADYSAWRGSRGYLYSRMSPGTYTLQVQARDGAGQISQIQPYTLVILPPWYRTWWAIGAATVVATLLLLGVIRVRTQRLALEKRQLEATVAERTRDLAEANARLQTMVNVDGLTGVANRRHLDEYLVACWQQCRERGRPLALLAIDVDHFKDFNDSHGHLAGDQYLRDLVATLDPCLRRTEDLLARYGGEEFVAIMPGADADIAANVGESMRRAIEAAQLGTTISVGVAAALPNGSSPEALLASADAALYRAKEGGRNRVVVADQAP